MSNQLNATQRKIVSLAKLQRGSQTRVEFFGDEAGISFSTYANFESGTRWPRTGNLRVLEDMLGWKPGVIDEALSSSMDPGSITLSHMKGSKSFSSARPTIQDFSNEEFF